MRNLVILFTAALLPLACGGAQPDAAAPAGAAPTEAGATESTPGESAPGESAPAAAQFKDMNHRERIDLMKTVVVPNMKAVFQSADAEHYADFGCETCHGPGAQRGEFDMPSASLPKLPANGQFDALKENKGEVVAFMMQQVLPEMAKSLGESPYDPATGEGFSCYDCHQSE